MYGTGFVPTDRASIYQTAEDDLYLVGTSEVPLAGLHGDQILTEEDLPLRYGGVSTCFRREAGAAGRDTRGIFRVHQFDKVEMFSFVRPEDSPAEHQRILGVQEAILQAIEVPYRVIDIAVGDLGASAARKFDCEAWMPAQGAYREVTSCSNCTDYQARRLRTRVRRESGTETVHTLNGTAVAIGRTIIAILENHQREDGSVPMPAALRACGAPEEIRPL
jgi:seryl-tRNA synthetase